MSVCIPCLPPNTIRLAQCILLQDLSAQHISKSYYGSSSLKVYFYIILSEGDVQVKKENVEHLSETHTPFCGVCFTAFLLY